MNLGHYPINPMTKRPSSSAPVAPPLAGCWLEPGRYWSPPRIGLGRRDVTLAVPSRERVACRHNVCPSPCPPPGEVMSVVASGRHLPGQQRRRRDRPTWRPKQMWSTSRHHTYTYRRPSTWQPRRHLHPIGSNGGSTIIGSAIANVKLIARNGAWWCSRRYAQILGTAYVLWQVVRYVWQVWHCIT